GDDAYTLRALVINDLAPFAFDDTQAEVRLAHLAPGSEAVELVQVTGDGANTIHSVGYAEVSGFGQFVPADGALELRVAGSEAVVLDLSDQQFDAGSSRTVFLIGTTVAEKPLEVIVVDNPAEAATAAARGVPAAPGADPAAAPVAVPPAANPAVAGDMTFYRDSLNEIEARLAEIEARLDGLLQVDGAEEAASAALQQLEEAMVLLNEARDRLAAQPTPVPADAPAAPGDADDAN